MASRTPHGVRGLKYLRVVFRADRHARRTPHGVRGLKCQQPARADQTPGSHPAWGAWIEIGRS